MRDSENLPFCLGISGGAEELDSLCLAMEDLSSGADMPMIAWSRSNGRGHRVVVLASLVVRNAVYSTSGAVFVSLRDALDDMKDSGSSLITHGNSAEAMEEYESWAVYSP